MPENSKVLRIGGNEYLVIDLNLVLSKDSEVFPGDPIPILNGVFCDIEKTGFQYHVQVVGDHNAKPHADSPSHQNPELHDRGMEYWTMDQVFNRAVMIDLSTSPDAEATSGVTWLIEVKKSHLEPFADQISGKGVVIIRTGYDKWSETNNPHDVKKIPYLAPDAARFLVEFSDLKVFATDSLTVDPPGVHEVHQTFKNLMIVESLVNLSDIPERSREDFTLMTSPQKIKGATGSPVAAYAFVEPD